MQVWTDGPVAQGDQYFVLGSNNPDESDPPNTMRGFATPLTTSALRAQVVMLGPADHLAIETRDTTTCYIAVLDLDEHQLLEWLADTQGAFPLTNQPPTQIDVGDAAQVGAMPEAARADHQHPLPAPPAPATAGGVTNDAGVSTFVARADHRHRVNVEVQGGGVLQGARPRLNFIGAVSVADNGANERVDVTVADSASITLQLANASVLPAAVAGVAPISGAIDFLSLIANANIAGGPLSVSLELAGGVLVPGSLVTLANGTAAFTPSGAVPPPASVAQGDAIIARFTGTNSAAAVASVTIRFRR
ncbi:hypothetical protein OV203_01515 [Nannocystis sp. ILAH1]|uniref:hypothetical protein n=1 Tax=Nannocystis sp. ILAH1 TaxID=2996789 RepID=UPI00226E3B96|nr:hypothetical protein [Nannocystis sp. ILAH1]MCY0985789.1 hypothetical protein [Nannocystis sp. ILAH1]